MLLLTESVYWLPQSGRTIVFDLILEVAAGSARPYRAFSETSVRILMKLCSEVYSPGQVAVSLLYKFVICQKLRKWQQI
jgi:hypothetical protein